MTVPNISSDGGSAEAALFAQYQNYSDFLKDFDAKTSTDSGIKDDVSCPVVCTTFRLTDDYCTVQSGNKLIDKCVMVLTNLALEMSHVNRTLSNTYLPALLVYGEDVDNELNEAGGAILMLSKLLPCLQEISVLVTHAYRLILNLVRQLSAILGPLKLFNANDIQLEFILEQLGQLLSTLLKFDEVISKHPILFDHWNSYLKTLQMIPNNPDKFDVDRRDVSSLDRVLQQLNNLLMSGFILQNAIEMPFDCADQLVTENRLLMDCMSNAIRKLLAKWENQFDQSQETDSALLIGVVCLTVLHHAIYKIVDKKLIKAVWQSYKKVPCLYLTGEIVWTPCEFLLSKIPDLDKVFDKKSRQSVLNQRRSIFDQRLERFAKDIQLEDRIIRDWKSQMPCLAVKWDVESELMSRLKLIIKGLKLAGLFGARARFLLNGHRLHDKQSISKPTATALFAAIRQLKTIEFTFRTRWLSVLDMREHIMQTLSRQLLKVVVSAGNNLKGKKKSEVNADTICALNIVQFSLSGAITPEKCLHTLCALTFVDMNKLSNEQQGLFNDIWGKMNRIVNLRESLRALCDCSFMYWHGNLLPSYFQSLFNDETGELHSNVAMFFCGLENIIDFVGFGQHVSPDSLRKMVAQNLYSRIEQSLLNPLCELIETDLRLSMHGHLQLDDRSPFLHTKPAPPLKALLSIPPLRLANQIISVHQYVERYLERTFYDLTTVALHDWKSYAEMRLLANSKFGLNPIEPHLPCQTLEQGLDLLEIMRNIRIFVANYCYNLNAQCFIERDSKNRNLDTLSIKHVANSIRTHGTGIMNTTVNYVYQFIKNHLKTFNQFLYDEQIKSRLMKDVRHFRENKDDSEGLYPFERADKLNRGIRKLGLIDGRSCLDNFRILITEIGNALGYVRLVRAGGLESCSRAISFIPDLDDIVPFAEYCAPGTVLHKTAQSFDSAIQSLVTNFAEGTEYFKLLIDTFGPNCRKRDLVHLHNFYIIVPPLMVNYVEYIINSKGKIGKRNQQIDAAFSDDGFAMGVAFLLKVLEQYDEFDSLQWFKSVQLHYSKAKDDVKKELKAAQTNKTDPTLTQTLTFSSKRLHIFQKEFDLVFFGLRSARIFFRSDLGVELIPKDNDLATSDTNSIASAAPSSSVVM